jgi:hypothetical protein
MMMVMSMMMTIEMVMMNDDDEYDHDSKGDKMMVWMDAVNGMIRCMDE